MKNSIGNMKDAFLNEWGLYTQDVPKAGVVYKYERASDLPSTTGEVKIGQLRILADIDPQLVVCAYRKQQRGFSWEIIPLSMFHFPATSGEALIGGRVFQIWNKQPISSYLMERSFLVDTLSLAEQRELKHVLDYIEDGKPLPGYLKSAIGWPVRDDEDPRLRYLSDFSIEPETFRSAEKAQVFVELRPQIIARAFEGYEFAAAAADMECDYTAAVVADRFPRTAKDFKRQYIECELKSQFLSLLPGERGERPLVYTWEGDAPAGWKDSSVAAYVAKTGELFGVGIMDVKTRRIVINDFSVSDGISVALNKASDLRLVMVPPEG